MLTRKHNRSNTFEGRCTECGSVVPADAGILMGPPWRVQCRVCPSGQDQETTRADPSAEIEVAKPGWLPLPTWEALYPFQRESVCWFLHGRRGKLLRHQMGLGKTICALCALPAGSPVVVIAPASVKSVWQREAFKWRPEFQVNVLKGRKSFRWPDRNEIVVLNYEILPGLEEIPDMDAPEGVVIIADEAHAFKHPQRKRTKKFRAMCREALGCDGYVWLLTGTPLLNRPPELWSILKCADLEKEAFDNHKTFLRLFRAYKTAWGTGWGKPDASVPGRLNRVSLGKLRSEVLPDLPVKRYRKLFVEDLPSETQRLCDVALNEISAAGIDIFDALNESQLTKISGAAFTKLSAARRSLAVAKIPVMLQVVEEFEDVEEPVVVFSYHRDPVDILGKRPGWANITGPVPPHTRAKIVDRFQAGKLKGLACTIQAGGTGLTLTKACNVVFVDEAWTPALNAQAADRLVRIGQTRGVVVTRIIAQHAIDERVSELLHAKQLLIDASIQNDAPVYVRAKTPSLMRRVAKTTTERWAIRALTLLASDDDDRARTENGVGFSKIDTDIGHSLVNQFTQRRKLTGRQWEVVVRIAKKYPRQVGKPPKGD